MEKTTNTFLNILKIVVIILLISFALNIVSTSTDFIRNLFKVPVADVDANEGININYNGGLTKSEIDKEKNDANCPTKDDVYDGLNIIELDNIVCFYKEIELDDGQTIYPNLLFVKTDNGLIYNGATNMIGTSVHYAFGITSFSVYQDYYNLPELDVKSNFFGGFYAEPNTKICLFDSGKCSFIRLTGIQFSLGSIVSKYWSPAKAMTATRNYINKEIYNKYFLTFCNDNIEIIMDNSSKDNAYADLNGFYDFVYRSAISHDYGKNDKGEALNKGLCTVDVSKLTVYPIPAMEQKNYPNGSDDYFHIFNTNVYLNVKYEKLEQECPIKVEEKNLKEKVDKKNEAIITTSTVGITFNPKYNTLDKKTIQQVVKNNPITISFYKDGRFVKKTVVTDTAFAQTDCKTTIGLENGKYTYTIDSAQILFDSYSGSVNIKGSSSIYLKYDYKDGYVLSTIGIEPASNDIDLSSLDLANNPIKIVLNSKNGETIQFIFDDNSKIGSQSQLLRVGKYTLTILSEKAIFSTLSTEIEITPQSRVFKYKFTLNQKTSDLNFNVSVSQQSGTTGKIKLYADSASVKILQNKLKETNYLVSLIIFDENGKIVEELQHTHSGSGACGDDFTATNLVANQKYNLQLTYRNADGSVVYTGATIGFTYNLNSQYTFTYTCTLAK